MLDWLIIGGGIHGMTLALYLTRRLKVARDRLRLLDPHDETLALWNRHTANTGMEYLRSPLVHHLNDDPWSLRTFAQTRWGESFARFIPLYERPSLDLFQAYSAWLIERNDANSVRIKGRAAGLTRLRDGWRVETEDGAIDAKNMLLAIGATEQPHYPQWSLPLHDSGAPINHIFEAGFIRDAVPGWSHAVIIGGGITAAQVAVTMAAQQPGTVTLMTRHPIKVTHFDADPCWVTRLCLADFHNEPNFNRRRAMIEQARNRGTMPPDVASALNDALVNGMLRLEVDEVMSADYNGKTISLDTKHGKSFESDRVILATGFDQKRPGGAWLERAIADYGLPVAECGYPIVDETLCWADGLYVSGPLAELEIGPVSRNIIGARLAGERLRAIYS